MTLDEAVSALKAHARQLEAVQVIASAISNVAAIDQLTQEAEQRRVKRQAEVDAAADNLDAMNAKLKDAQEKVLSANARAQSIIEDAKQKAVSILEKAQADAVAAAEKAGAAARADAEKWGAVANKASDDASAALNAIADANDVLAAKRAEIADLDGKIEAARNIMANFMGGR